MSLGSLLYVRWLLVPIAATLAAGVMAWIVRIAATLLPRLFPNLLVGIYADLFWKLVLVPGMESALLGFAFVQAAVVWRQLPKLKLLRSFQT
ncbi:MAG: hypothetical protein JWP29_5537 [Rhodoferax sp.]|nr:hypothetical protein [Rhodoferax sp.]